MASSWGTSWGDSWGDSWGPISVNPNDMRGSASFSFTATADLTGGGITPGVMSGSASFAFYTTADLTAAGTAQSGVSRLKRSSPVFNPFTGKYTTAIDPHSFEEEEEIIMSIILEIAAHEYV